MLDAFTARYADLTRADVLESLASGVALGVALAMLYALLPRYRVQLWQKRSRTVSEWPPVEDPQHAKELNALVTGTSRPLRAGFQQGHEYGKRVH